MNNLIKLTVAILISFSFLTSCTSKSAEKAQEGIKAENISKESLSETRCLFEQQKAENQNLDKETLSEIDSIFEKTSKDVNAFVSKYDNWNDSYYWKSDNSDDKPYDMIRLCGMRILPDIFIIEKRSSNPNSTDVVGYSVEREKKNGKTTYMLETSFFRNNKEIESRRKVFMLSTAEELATALKPFYKRLKEAKQDVKKNISRIEKMADKS